MSAAFSSKLEGASALRRWRKAMQTSWDHICAWANALFLVRFDFLLVLVALLALLTPQGRDILIQLMLGSITSRWGFLLTCALLGCWVWLHARVVFQLDLGPRSRSSIGQAVWLKTWLPRLLGASVAALPATFAFIEVGRIDLAILALILLAILVLRRGLWKAIRQPSKAKAHLQDAVNGPARELEQKHDQVSQNADPGLLTQLWGEHRATSILWIGLLLASPVVVATVALWPGALPWSSGSALMIAVLLISAGGGALALAADYCRIPLVAFVLIFMMIIGWLIPRPGPCATGSCLDGYAEKTQPSQHDNWEEILDAWNARIDDSQDSTENGRSEHSSVRPLILVSASGGGVRAAYWTATVLGELAAVSERFEQHLFAASGVSGGSLGLVTYRTALENCRSEPDWNENRRQCLVDKSQNALGKDLLTPVLGKWFFNDLFASVFPLMRLVQDRGVVLEQRWQHVLEKEFGNIESVTKPLRDTRTDPATPYLLLNATELSSGRRLIQHDLPLELSRFQESFVHAIDGGCLLPNQSWIQAAHHSARFPIISPVARIRIDDATSDRCGLKSRERRLRIGDGGYFDNSGSMTMREVLVGVLEASRPDQPSNQSGQRRYQPILVHIENDPSHTNPTRIPIIWRLAPSLTDPLLALASTRTRRGLMGFDQSSLLAPRQAGNDSSQVPVSIRFRLNETFEYNCIDENSEFKDGAQRMPLGWLLSDPASTEISRQICHQRNLDAAKELLEKIGDGLGFSMLQERCRSMLGENCSPTKPGNRTSFSGSEQFVD